MDVEYKYCVNELYDGVQINYYFKDKTTIPAGVRIEPIYTTEEPERDMRGRFKRRASVINVYGEYEKEGERIIDRGLYV